MQIFKQNSQSKTLLFAFLLLFPFFKTKLFSARIISLLGQIFVCRFSNRTPKSNPVAWLWFVVVVVFFSHNNLKQNYSPLKWFLCSDKADTSGNYENLIAINPIGLRLLFNEAMDPSDCQINTCSVLWENKKITCQSFFFMLVPTFKAFEVNACDFLLLLIFEFQFRLWLFWTGLILKPQKWRGSFSQKVNDENLFLQKLKS